MKSKSWTIAFLSVIIWITTFHCSKDSSLIGDSHFGQSFSIKINEVKSITPVSSNNPDSIVNLRFKEVLSDNRCSKASCYLCYGSTACIQVVLTHQNVTATISLSILGCQDEYVCDEQLYYRKDTLGYRICLLRLDPYPEGNNLVNPLNYTAKLNITKL
jgi:hypothetical protein